MLEIEMMEGIHTLKAFGFFGEYAHEKRPSGGAHKKPPSEAPPVILDIGASVKQVKSMRNRHQGSAKVMYWLSVSVSDSIVGHIQDANSPKDAWDNLFPFNATNTRARKIQLKNELNTIKKEDLSVNDYTLKIKALCESLSSIGVAVDDDDKAEACLRGLDHA
ncbi:hypothetical protein L7F22_050992 [Adiantum nelumboides]|nr:hypothetical protein [Adiantum nelumboides]